MQIRDYWNYREEISLDNGLLFKSQRVIVPKAMRSEILSRIHSSHQGIVSCLRKAKDIVFWPGMNSEIKALVERCSICAEFHARNACQPMQSHQIPDRPWSKVSNGKTQSSVKAVKKMFKKAKRDGKDPWLGLLDYRNTPTEGINASLPQRLMSCRTRTLLPTASSLLRPEVCTQSTE